MRIDINTQLESLWSVMSKAESDTDRVAAVHDWLKENARLMLKHGVDLALTSNVHRTTSSEVVFLYSKIDKLLEDPVCGHTLASSLQR